MIASILFFLISAILGIRVLENSIQKSLGLCMSDYNEILIILVLHYIVFFLTDIEEDEYENHRSCWKHIAYLNTRDSKPKLTEEEFELLKVTAPCFYEECTRRERSRRRVKCKYLVSKLRKKLNSNIFINYLE